MEIMEDRRYTVVRADLNEDGDIESLTILGRTPVSEDEAQYGADRLNSSFDDCEYYVAKYTR